MLRICPKCGFVDPPEWKHVKYSFYIDYCTYDNFKSLHPNLAENLGKPKRHTEDELYIYYRTKSGQYVQRKAKIDIGLRQKWADGCEKHDKQFWKTRKTTDEYRHWILNSPNQTKLFEGAE